MRKDDIHLLENLGNRLFGEGDIDTGIALRKLLKTLKSSADKPVCPACKEPMQRIRYTGYYDSFDYWECDCDWGDSIEPTAKHRGDYA